MKTPKASSTERQALANVALGLTSPDCIFRISQLYNPWTKIIEPSCIWVKDGRVARLTSHDDVLPVGILTIDITEGVVAPGFVDGHVHFESSLLSPEGFAELATNNGVTSIVTDYHEVACVLGYKGIEAMADRFAAGPLKVWGLSPCPLPFIPAHEATRASLSLDEVTELLKRPDFLGISEVIGAELTGTRTDVKDAVDVAIKADVLVEGHLFRTLDKSLDACVALGVDSDHEPRAEAEVLDKLRRGLFVMLRQGTLAREVERLAPGLAASGVDLANIAFVTDDMLPTDIVTKGYFSERLALVTAAGYPTTEALRAVTLAPALHYGLHWQVGSLRPGCWADMVVLEDLTNFRVSETYIAGALIGNNGKGVKNLTPWPQEFLSTVDYPQSSAEVAETITRQLMEGLGSETGQIVTVSALELDETTRFVRLTDYQIPVIDGLPNVGDTDLAYIVCMNRTTGKLGLGFLAGYGLASGAIAVSMAHDHHNLVAIGKKVDSLVEAVTALKNLGGGIVVTNDQCNVKASFPMEVAGLLSTLEPEVACSRLNGIIDTLRQTGARWSQPLFYLFFLAMPVAPEYRITEEGVLQISTGLIVDVFRHHPDL